MIDKGLEVVEASAGTGKTYSLVTKLVSLMADADSPAEPERIVALTFTRKAAGEIFNRLIARLAGAAGSESKAAQLDNEVGRGFAGLGRAGYAALLRKVIAGQHMTAIGTIDSFMLRLLRAAPLEAGVGARVDIMDDYRASAEKERLVEQMFKSRHVDTGVLADAFSNAFGTDSSRKYDEALRKFIDKWHDKYCDDSRETRWGESSAIWPDGVPEELGEASIEAVRALSAPLGACSAIRGAETFRKSVASWNGGKLPRKVKALEGVPVVEKIRRLMSYWRIGRKLETMRGIRSLLREYETLYSSEIRSRGRIVFGDIPRLIASIDPGERAAMEYRMDCIFRHWAIDEFQDTSDIQWEILENLIDECWQSGDSRSVFVVGDRKQAIYAWRDGDAKLISRMAALARLPGNKLHTLTKTYRCSQAVCDAVNKVFDERFVADVFPAMEHAPDEWTWRFEHHVPCARPGESAIDCGFVEVLQAERSKFAASIEDFLPLVSGAVERARRHGGTSHTTAILVRKNEHARRIAEYLKTRAGVADAMYVGESSILDSPVIEAFIDMARLAAYPADSLAYAHIKFTPLAAALARGGTLEDRAALSARLLAEFTRLGLERFFRETRENLKAVPGTWNAATEARFAQLLRAAADFDKMREGTEGIADFADFAAEKTKRDAGSQRAVAVMTIHQAKGLEFDHVIIPLFESKTLSAVKQDDIICGEYSQWMLMHPGKEEVEVDETLRRAELRRRQSSLYEELCVAYVAMTRAKKALTLILHPLNKNDDGARNEAGRISDLVRMAPLSTFGDRMWAAHCEAGNTAAEEEEDPHPASGVRRGAADARRIRPSEAFAPGATADMLFSEGFGSAARRGEALHGQYAAIEWLDAARDGFERAFVKPSENATVWRERKYELYVDGQWETGVFDRVVFSGGQAVIYDFKTNAVREGESREDFARRLSATYSGQMMAYRRALSALAGLPDERIDTVILAEATRDAIFVK